MFKEKNAIDKVIWIITVFLIASFLLFDSYAWGKISFFVCAAVIAVLSAFENRGKIRIGIGAFFGHYFAFAVFTVLSALWSLDSANTLIMARTLFRTIVCFLPIYWHYRKEEKSEQLITAVVFASYFVAIYSLLFYGFDNIVMAAAGRRLDNEYANVNAIAILLAIGCFCDWYLTLFKRKRITSLCSLLSLVLIAAFQSRKAMVVILFGFAALLYFKLVIPEKRRTVKRVVGVIVVVAILHGVLSIISELSLASGALTRMTELLNLFIGEGKVDNSTLVRQQMLHVGWETWKEHPLFGVGIAGVHIVASAQMSRDSYLHNNYVEILSGGGIVGFLLFYSTYFMIWRKIKKIKQRDYPRYVFCTLFVVILLILDWGRVSYYSKTFIFQFMMLYILACGGEQRGAVKENVTIVQSR